MNLAGQVLILSVQRALRLTGLYVRGLELFFHDMDLQCIIRAVNAEARPKDGSNLHASFSFDGHQTKLERKTQRILFFFLHSTDEKKVL